jgi:hypothetical protein
MPGADAQRQDENPFRIHKSQDSGFRIRDSGRQLRREKCVVIWAGFAAHDDFLRIRYLPSLNPDS